MLFIFRNVYTHTEDDGDSVISSFDNFFQKYFLIKYKWLNMPLKHVHNWCYSVYVLTKGAYTVVPTHNLGTQKLFISTE